MPYNDIPLQPLQTPKKADEAGPDGLPQVLPVNIANGSINISMGKMAQGLSNQAAHLPKISAISPSLSLPKLQGNGAAAAAAGGMTAGAAMAGAHHHATADTAAGMAAAAGASTAVVGDAVNHVRTLRNRVIREGSKKLQRPIKSCHVTTKNIYQSNQIALVCNA